MGASRMPMPYALCPMPARAPHVTEKGYILLSFNLSRILVFGIVGNPRIGLNRYSGNALAIYNLSFHDYPVNYYTSVRLGTIAC